MRLEHIIPLEKDLLSMSLSDLADKVLFCLEKSAVTTPIKRKGLPARLLMGYPNEFGKDCRLVLEEVLMYLENKMFIGVDPDEGEFVFITRSGRSHLEQLLASPSVR